MSASLTESDNAALGAVMRAPTFSLLAVALSLALAGCANQAKTERIVDHAAISAAPASGQTSKAAELRALYEAYWEENLARNPLAATFQGDPRYNDLLPNFLSSDYREETHAFNARWLEKIRGTGPAGLEGQELLSYEIFVRDMEQALESEQFPGWMQPINQFGNVTQLAVQLGSGTGAQPFKTVKDYDNWLARSSRFPVLIDQAIANMREGVAAGVVQPRPLMVKVLPQLDDVIKARPEDTLFWLPITNIPSDFAPGEKARLTTGYREMIGTQILPSLKRLRTYIADEYLAKTRVSAGLDALPNGQAWYAFNARNSTTTDMSPAEIHQLGLNEVARIHGEIRGVMAEVEFKGSLQEFFHFMQTDPRFTFKDEAALLAHYRGLEAKINRKVPEQFSLIPKSGFEIRPVEPFRAQSSAGGSYQTPSEDGTRPGVFYVNTYDCLLYTSPSPRDS